MLDNLTKSFPKKSADEIRQLAKGAYRNLTEVIVEIIKGKTLSEKEMRKRVTLINEHDLTDAVKNNQSALVLTSHSGNWEWLITGTAANLAMPIYGVYRPLANKFFNKLMLQIRSRFGGRPVPEKTIFRKIVREKEPRIIGIIADQTPNNAQKQVWLKFLGRDTNFFVGTEKIAQLMQYPVYFAGMKRIKRGYYTITFEKLENPPHPQDSFRITEKYAIALEKLITENPTSWLWSHRRWKRKKPVEI